MSARTTLAAALILTAPLAAPLADVPSASASEVISAGSACTVLRTAAEQEDVLALSGVFAANWSAEILRDIPAAAEEMAVARSWHADKTSEASAEMPVHVREAVDRVNAAGQRVGYRGDEATAPLRVLVERNDLRRAGTAPLTMSVDRAAADLETSLRTGAPPMLADLREQLSVPAEESWQRAWERTPGASAETAAAGAELRLCAEQASGTVDRANATAQPSPSPELPPLVLGLPLGQIHLTTVLELFREVGVLSR